MIVWSWRYLKFSNKNIKWIVKLSKITHPVSVIGHSVWRSLSSEIGWRFYCYEEKTVYKSTL